MKIKSKFFILPASLLLLSACGGADTSIPKSYAPVDITKSEDRTAFFNKLADDVGVTYAKAAEGFLYEGKFFLKELSYSKERNSELRAAESEAPGNVKESFTVSDLEFNYSIGLVGLNENIGSVKAVVKVDDFAFNFSYTARNGKVTSLKAKDVDIAGYISEGNIYVDASDKELKNLAYDFIDFEKAVDSELNDQDVAEARAEVDKYVGKHLIKNVLGSLAEEVGIDKTLDSSLIAKISSTLDGGYTSILSTNYSNMLSLAEDKASKGVAVSLALTNNGTVLEEGLILKGDLAATVVFDKNGLFEKFAVAGNANLTERRSSSTLTLDVKKVNFEGSMKYGKDVVKLPDLSGYKELAIDLD